MTADSSLGHILYVHPSSIPGGINSLGNDDGFGGDTDDFLGQRDNGKKLWETKYRFRKDMLPLFVGESFGKKVSLDLCPGGPFSSFFFRFFPREKVWISLDTVASIATGLWYGKKWAIQGEVSILVRNRKFLWVLSFSSSIWRYRRFRKINWYSISSCQSPTVRSFHWQIQVAWSSFRLKMFYFTRSRWFRRPVDGDTRVSCDKSFQ